MIWGEYTQHHCFYWWLGYVPWIMPISQAAYSNLHGICNAFFTNKIVMSCLDECMDRSHSYSIPFWERVVHRLQRKLPRNPFPLPHCWTICAATSTNSIWKFEASSASHERHSRQGEGKVKSDASVSILRNSCAVIETGFNCYYPGCRTGWQIRGQRYWHS